MVKLTVTPEWSLRLPEAQCKVGTTPLAHREEDDDGARLQAEQDAQQRLRRAIVDRPRHAAELEEDEIKPPRQV